MMVAIMTPSSYSLAVKSPKWREAMADEINAMLNCGTWYLVPKPTNKNLVLVVVGYTHLNTKLMGLLRY